MNTAIQPMYEWNRLPWKEIEKGVLKLQKRIYQDDDTGTRAWNGSPTNTGISKRGHGTVKDRKDLDYSDTTRRLSNGTSKWKAKEVLMMVISSTGQNA